MLLKDVASADLKFCYLESLVQNRPSTSCLSSLGQVLQGQKRVTAAETDVLQNGKILLLHLGSLAFCQFKSRSSCVVMHGFGCS